MQPGKIEILLENIYKRYKDVLKLKKSNQNVSGGFYAKNPIF